MGDAIFSVVIYPLTQIIEFVFSFCNKIFDSIPFALIGVSLAVSLLTLPLYIVAEHWTQVERDIQKRMKLKIRKIKAVFDGDEQYMILSTYYRQQHYHPIMSLRSAFGLLIQIPFFTAAYYCLSNMTVLQGQSFWIFKDLSKPDAVFSIGSFNVNILPLLMTAINCISGTIYTKGLGLRDKLQVYGLAFVFVAILYNSPSGLVIYWTMNNLFSLVKNVFYKLKHPIKTLYIIACSFVTVLIVFLFAGHVLSFKRAILVAIVFSLVYFAPFIVKVCNFLIDSVFISLRNNFRKRTVLFLLSTLSICFLLGFLIPTVLISSSPMEFSGIDGYGSPMFFVWNTFWQAVGLCVVWPCLVYFLFHERIQTLLSFGLFYILICSLLNAFVFKGDYGILSTLLVFTTVPNVDSPLKFVLLNFMVMFFLLLVIILLTKFKIEKLFAWIAGMAVFSILGVSVVNSITIKSDYTEYMRIANSENTTENDKSIPKIFHLSRTGKNIILIYLDRAQNKFLEPIFEECPELYSQFDGFTLYKNTISLNGYTLLGAPPCFGGYEYAPEAMNARKTETLVEKQNQSLLMLPRIFTEQAENFYATVTDPVWANYNWVTDISIFNGYDKISAYKTDKTYLDKWYREHTETAKITVTSDTLKRNILWYGFFRLSPYVLRPAFYNDGNYWSTNTKNKNFDEFLAGYSAIDYLIDFTDFDSKTENTYINFTNNTTHDDMFLQAPNYIPVSKVTNYGNSVYKYDESFHCMAGALKRLGEWLEILQKEDVYKNCRIVIVADHGNGGGLIGYENWSIDGINPERLHPLLMVKDFGATGRLEINNDFMTNADVPYLILQGIVDTPINPFTENEIIENDKNDGVLVCTEHMFMPHQSKSKYVFTVSENSWYRVKKNIFYPENWTQEIQEAVK